MRTIKTRYYPIFNSIIPFKQKDSQITVKNLTDKSADLYIYGEIVDNTDYKWDEKDVMPDDVKNALEQVDGLETLNIYINSPGGSVFSGTAIYNMLKRNKAKKIVHIDGVAASMASVIALVGDEIYMPSNAFMMIHKPLTWVVGNANDLRKVADDLDVIEEGLIEAYKEKLKDGADVEEIKQMLNDETWLTAEKASQYFDINVIEAKQISACAKHLLKEYKNVPKALIEENTFKTISDEEKLKFQNELDLLTL